MNLEVLCFYSENYGIRMLSMYGYDLPVKYLVRLSAAVITFTVLSHFFAFGTAFAAGKTPLRIGDLPPRGVLSDLKGRIVRLPDDYRGKVLIIHFWAVGCSSCKVEMSAMESLYASNAGKGLAIVAVNVGQGRDTVEKMVKTLGISYGVLLDSDRSMAQRYDVVGIPRTYLIDRSGIIRYKIVGESSEDFLKKRILSML
jgi:cytochrome c biogenesis protein CcmG, thiol:disulfide interchange protein DsbE